MNPIPKVEEYLKKDKRGHGGSMANMLINGKLIYGNKEIIRKLRRKAHYYLNKKNKKDNQYYYHAWDMYDDYKACKYHKKMPYYNALQAIIEAYLYNNDYLLLPPQKIERVFKDEEYRKNYKINKFPNNYFNKLVINCFDNPNEKNIENLYNYVMEDGNFNINNFKLKSKLQKGDFVIERLGGIMTNTYYNETDNCLVRRYVINVNQTIEEHGSEYEPKILR